MMFFYRCFCVPSAVSFKGVLRSVQKRGLLLYASRLRIHAVQETVLWTTNFMAQVCGILA